MGVPTGRRRRIVLGAGAAFIGAWCLAIGIAVVTGGTNSAGSAAPETSAPKSAAPKTAASPESGLVAFGATDAVWDANHEADRRFSPGSVYDPDPLLARGGDQRYNARYYLVSHDYFGSGRVLSYEMRFPPATTVEEAKRAVLASEFPRDARVVWFKRRHACAQMLVRSRELARATDGLAALVQFGSGEADDRYDSNDVWRAILMATTPGGPGSALAC